MDVVLFPNAQAALVTLLKAELKARGDKASVSDQPYRPVSTTKAPERLVTITSLRSRRRDVAHDRQRLDVHCYATDSYGLANLVRGILLAQPSVDEDSGPMSLPNPLSETPRHVFTISATVHGHAEG